jgi:filamin
MEYLPVKAGPYDITIKYADQDVPGSPYRVYIEDKVDSNKVSVQLPKKPCRVNTPAEIVVDARNAGKAEPRVDLYDSHGRMKPVPLGTQPGAVDGIFVGSLVPNIEGPHKLDVKWNGAPISGSPFHINVLPKFEPHKV